MKSGSIQVAQMKHCRQNAGFPLLEMMLVVGLIALTATFVGLNVARSDAKLADLEAKRFVSLLNLAQDESIVSGRPILLTIDVATHFYQFAPLDVPPIFLSDAEREEELVTGHVAYTGYSPQTDSFFKPRHIPEKVKISFSLLSDLPGGDAGDAFVPKRVHEILNKSLFEKRDQLFEDENTKTLILIEPDGLVSPFALSLSIDGRVSNVGLDRFGRAALRVSK
jgi:type II secretion system protein H